MKIVLLVAEDIWLTFVKNVKCLGLVFGPVLFFGGIGFVAFPSVDLVLWTLATAVPTSIFLYKFFGMTFLSKTSRAEQRIARLEQETRSNQRR